jgi:hypothetical protein
MAFVSAETKLTTRSTAETQGFAPFVSLVGIVCRRLDWDDEVRKEGGVAVAGERDCVLEDCLWARGVVSWGSEEGEGEDIRLWSYRGAASALSSMRRARSGGR